MTILAATTAVIPTVAVTASGNSSSGGVSSPPPIPENGENGSVEEGPPTAPAQPLPSARSRWKKLTGTAMFINRLGKTAMLS